MILSWADRGALPLQSLATEENVELLDIYGVFEGRPELFFDGVHPERDRRQTARGDGVSVYHGERGLIHE